MKNFIAYLKTFDGKLLILWFVLVLISIAQIFVVNYFINTYTLDGINEVISQSNLDLYKMIMTAIVIYIFLFPVYLLGRFMWVKYHRLKNSMMEQREANHFLMEMEKEILEIVKTLGLTVYPNLNKSDDIFLQLLANKADLPVHGDYIYDTNKIVVYDALNLSKEALIVNAICLYSHHIECLETGSSGHSKNYYRIFYALLAKAKELGYTKSSFEKMVSENMLDADALTMFNHFEENSKE